MTLRINLLGEKVQAFCDDQLLDLGNDDFVLGLLTPWYEIKGEVRKFSIAEITRTTANRQQIGKLHTLNDPQSRVRHAKRRLQTLLSEACRMSPGAKFEEILERAQIDVVLFRQALDQATREPIKILDPIAVEQALLLYGGRLFDGYSVYDYEMEAKIEEMQKYYDDMFCRGIKILLQKRSPRLHNIVVSKSIQIQKSLCLKTTAPQLLKTYNRLLVKNADRIPLEEDENTPENATRVEPKENGTATLQISGSESSYEETRRVAEAASSINPLGLSAEFRLPGSWNRSSLINNLPQQVTTFIGREKELDEVKSLLEKTRLLSLTGSGGCGKTRLALQVAREFDSRYPDGVWLVELALLADPVLVAHTVMQTLNIVEEADRTPAQTLVEALKPRRLLLVLDNCEHLLDACAQLADTLLHSCPNITILASSREVLGIAGETAYRVPALSRPVLKQIATPASLENYEAVRLFVDRATSALPAFTVTNANAPALASVCHRLDGIPLALELAAARVRALSVEQINDRLDDSFRLLTVGNRTALPKHQTLRALIDWSYELLEARERTLLNRLSVFADGWTLEAAEQVCSGEGIQTVEILDSLTSHVDKSLVFAEDEECEKRYHLQETMRQYAAEKLNGAGETERIKRRHRDWYLALARSHEKQAAEAVRENWAAEEEKTSLTRLLETMNLHIARRQSDDSETKQIEFQRQTHVMIHGWTHGSQAATPDQSFWLRLVEREYANLRAALKWNLEEAELESCLRFCDALQTFWTVRGYFSEGLEWYQRALAKANAQERTAIADSAVSIPEQIP